MKPHLECISDLGAVKSEEWNKLVPDSNPFQKHEFLRALEETGCVGTPESGWLPRHVLIRPGPGKALAGALILYEKYNSYGEYIFDWEWARAAQMANIPYYPKLVSAIPFTPASGNRLLVSPQELLPKKTLYRLALEAVGSIATISSSSSAHSLFHTAEEAPLFEAEGFEPRSSFQFHWERAPHWCHFEDYLGDMKASARKQIRRERRIAQEHGLTLRTLRGEELSDLHWDTLWRLYQTTTSHKHAVPYLTRAFFDNLKGPLKEHVVATFAENSTGPIAGALFFTAGDQLFGRYWGTLHYLNCMHFELCYYLPIEWALKNGINRFEAGAQGEHKLKRGFLPKHCYSSHWIAHPGLARAVTEFLPREARGVDETIHAFNRHSPYKDTKG